MFVSLFETKLEESRRYIHDISINCYYNSKPCEHGEEINFAVCMLLKWRSNHLSLDCWFCRQQIDLDNSMFLLQCMETLRVSCDEIRASRKESAFDRSFRLKVLCCRVSQYQVDFTIVRQRFCLAVFALALLC